MQFIQVKEMVCSFFSRHPTLYVFIVGIVGFLSICLSVSIFMLFNWYIYISFIQPLMTFFPFLEYPF